MSTDGFVPVRVAKKRGRSLTLLVPREEIAELISSDLAQYREEVARINGKRASLEAKLERVQAELDTLKRFARTVDIQQAEIALTGETSFSRSEDGETP